MQTRNTFAAEADRLARAASMSTLGITPKEARQYSLSRAILGAADGKVTGFESEVDQEVRNKRGLSGSTNGSIYVATGVPLRRDLTSTSGSAGGYLVGTDNLAPNFVDLLRQKMLAAALGVSIIPGLKGNVTIPKQTAGATAYWLTNEGTAITESNPTFGQVSLSPKTCGAYTEFSRQLLMQSNPGVDSIVANDLTAVVARAADAAIFSGTGAGGQPTGIALTAGIGSVTGTSLGLAGLLEFVSDISGAGAIDPRRLGYVTTPTVAALLMQRQRFTGTDTPLWEGNVLEGKILGATAFSSPSIAADSMICGDWSEIILAEWGFVELATNPFANFQTGIIGVRCMHSVDVGVRQAGAFSMATSIT